ncbi:5-methylcytosine-specific restriction endonuclease system specificity protein McrC [Rhodococcus opacus]|uniref:5-methylcytosine-specific restriction endonuclease system specificity protein McrC n=1 Tax=Rhodococcus opacus TaxID=37919 RepID=UPI001C468064|nr:5-methylcytosine-specific restriction endonuclease system specificity protein McrC [Rhodococcus opacus]MBV6757797.1 5-methylcytosine-specific restriction endonuclease system specificity protein McrC [Rhodococcus opacus]
MDIASEDGQHGYVLSGSTRIPVRNIWLLMLYASKLYQEEKLERAGIEDQADDIPDLVAELLATEVERRLHRNLTHGFRERRANLSRVRGRIDLLETESRQLLRQGLVACRFDDLTVDTRRNRYVRTALETAVRRTRSSDVQNRCRTLASTMRSLGVQGVRPGAGEMSRESLGRNDADDRRMMSAARLVFDLQIPTETTGSETFARPGRGDGLRDLYEKAVRGFYSATLKAPWSVQPRRIRHWPIEAATMRIGAHLPRMETDTVLENRLQNRRVIVETKFTSSVEKGRHGGERFKTGHIYQLYAYVRAQSEEDPLARHTTGVLLYPVIEGDLNEAMVVHGHVIRFMSVDLAATPATIKAQLDRVIDDVSIGPDGDLCVDDGIPVRV